MFTEIIKFQSKEEVERTILSILKEESLDLKAICIRLQNQGFQSRDGTGTQFAQTVMLVIADLRKAGHLVKEGNSYSCTK